MMPFDFNNISSFMIWMNRKNFCLYFLALFCVVVTVFYLLSFWFMWGPAIKGEVSFVNSKGNLVGSDFCVYYSASFLTLNGKPALAYNPDMLEETITQLTEFKDKKYPFSYPPTFLLIILPLSLLSYLGALAAWLSVTLAGNLAVLRRIAPHVLTPWMALAFPATFLNILCGQNGFLSAVFLGGGLLLLDRRPWLGGVLLGFMSYKPHLSVLVPLALLAGRHWKALLAAGLTVAGTTLLSGVVFGWETWSAFWRSLLLSSQLLQTGEFRLQNMSSFFAFALSAGWNLSSARLLQGIIMAAVAGGVAAAWFKQVPIPIRNAILILGAILFSPYFYHYDLIILLPALAWLGWHGYQEGWFFGERSLLFLIWVAPFVYFRFWNLTLTFPLLPLLILILFLIIVTKYLGKRQTTFPEGNR